MTLKPGFEAKCKHQHDEIWPELAALLGTAGISDNSIFLDEERLTLFAVQKLANDDNTTSPRTHPVMGKWWDHMADLVQTHSDNSPVEQELKQVFYFP